MELLLAAAKQYASSQRAYDAAEAAHREAKRAWFTSDRTDESVLVSADQARMAAMHKLIADKGWLLSLAYQIEQHEHQLDTPTNVG